MVRFEGITVPNENLTGKRLDTNVGGKYWQKTIPKMAKLASFLHKLNISWPITNFKTFFVACFTYICTNDYDLYRNSLWGQRWCEVFEENTSKTY